MKLLHLTFAAIALALAGPTAAQDFPERPMTMVVPRPAGGIADLGARVHAKAMAATRGKPIVIDNKPGAGGIVGASFAVNQKPDGYTMFYGSDTAIVFKPTFRF